MGKRKEASSPLGRAEDESHSSDRESEILDVEFEFFDPQPEHDFYGVKSLLRQLLGADAQLIDLSALTDLILSQPLLGSTVKVEGNESDPYAFLTVLNLHELRNKPVIRTLIQYIMQRAGNSQDLSTVVATLDTSSSAQVGLILCERLMNLPNEVIPPMYKMLLEEIDWALEEKEPYALTHYLVLSKSYVEVESSLDYAQDQPPQKKKKKRARVRAEDHPKEVFHFHPEDEILLQKALASGDFQYIRGETDGETDSRRAFQDLGIKPQGRVILIEASKFAETVKAMEEYFHQP